MEVQDFSLKILVGDLDPVVDVDAGVAGGLKSSRGEHARREGRFRPHCGLERPVALFRISMPLSKLPRNLAPFG